MMDDLDLWNATWGDDLDNFIPPFMVWYGPAKSINYIKINTIITKNAANFDEIIGSF